MKANNLQSDPGSKARQHFPIRLILGYLSLFLGLSTVLGDGYFSARNLGGAPVLGEYWGDRLQKETARIEILDEGLLLARGGFCNDGFFALGTVYDPQPGIVRPLILRIWDLRMGTTYEQAEATGRGFVWTVLPVRLATGANPPPALGENFYGLKLQSNPDTEPGYNPFFTLLAKDANTYLGPNGGATYQLFNPNPSGPAFPLTNSVDNLRGFGTATGFLHWVYTPIEPPHIYGLLAPAIMRVWNSSSGTNYETAKLRGSAAIVLSSGLGIVNFFSSNPFPIALVKAESPSVGLFQAPGGVVRVLDMKGNPVPQGGCQVEILAGTNHLKSFALPEDGQFPLPPMPVPGTLPLDGAVISVRAWDPQSGLSFDEASIFGRMVGAVQLGGDNLPAATLYTNVIQMGLRTAIPATKSPEVVPSARQRISAAAGSLSSLSVTAFGGELQYAWQLAGSGTNWITLDDTPTLKGTHTATLEFPAATIQQAGLYRVVVSNRIGSATNTPTALFVHDSGSIQFIPTPSFHFGSDTVLQPVTPETLPVSLSVTAGPASASALPDGRFRVHPTGVGSVVFHASQTTSNPYAFLTTEFTFPILKGQQSLLLPDLPLVIASGASISVPITSNYGLPVGMRVVSGPATLLNGILHASGLGTVVLNASQAGNENYEAVEVTLSIAVVTRPQAVRLNEQGGAFVLSFRGDAGKLHLVESAPSVDGPWEEVAQATGNGLDQDTTVALPELTGSTRFFRIRIQ